MEYLFPPDQIPEKALANFPLPYSIRPLSLDDYNNGFLDTLKQLTTVGDVSFDQYKARFEHLKKLNDIYKIIVVVDQSDGHVVGSGTVMLEHKFIHECGLAGHIEDIVVHDKCRGKKLGLYIIEALKEIGKSCGAYKIILDCSDSNVGFYEKCGFVRKGAQMAYYCS